MPPPCFSKAILYLRCSASLIWVRVSRVPQHHRYYQSTTTSCDEYGVAYVVRFSAPTDPLQSLLPCGGELRSGLAPFKPGTAGYHRLVTHRSSQVPGESIPYLCPALRSRPAHRPSPLPVRRCCPQARHAEDASTRRMSGFNYAASISAAYASSDALPHPHARLASGRWLAFTGWESNPLDSIEKFLPVTSDLLLSQVYPGASLDSSHAPWQALDHPVKITGPRN